MTDGLLTIHGHRHTYYHVGLGVYQATGPGYMIGIGPTPGGPRGSFHATITHHGPPPFRIHSPSYSSLEIAIESIDNMFGDLPPLKGATRNAIPKTNGTTDTASENTDTGTTNADA